MCQIQIEPHKSIDYLDVAFKTATIFIAVFNAYFAIKIFRLKNQREDVDKEKDRKMQLLKTLVLDHNLKYFYELFDKIETELLNLKQPNLTDTQKETIDTTIGDFFISLRRKFYDSLLAIDGNLYDGIKGKADKLQEELSNTIFDPGINLSHTPKYDELIKEKLSTAKTNIIKNLFAYRG